MRWSTLVLISAGALAASAGTARAATYEVCLRIPVTIDDETGHPNEVGGDGNWIARGIRIEYVRAPNGGLIAGFPAYASSSTGCFTFSSIQSGDFDVAIQPRGYLAGNNYLSVRTPESSTTTYEATLSLTTSQSVYVLPNEYHLPRMYAIYAYMIQEGFRGNYNDESLYVYYGDAPGCACNRSCTINDDANYNAICSDDARRKFVMGHEYGHANLSRATSSPSNNDCSYATAGASTSSHEMRSLENNSCAAMEGWAHFVSADVWNAQAGSDPDAQFRYWGDGNALVEVEDEQGGCWTSLGDNTGDYQRRFADVCFGTPGMWDYTANCVNGNCNGYGTELDWMRFWWDFHTDTDLPGAIPGHADLQELIDAAGSWSDNNAWDVLRNSLSGTTLSRWSDASVWNGTSEP